MATMMFPSSPASPSAASFSSASANPFGLCGSVASHRSQKDAHNLYSELYRLFIAPPPTVVPVPRAPATSATYTRRYVEQEEDVPPPAYSRGEFGELPRAASARPSPPSSAIPIDNPKMPAKAARLWDRVMGARKTQRS